MDTNKKTRKYSPNPCIPFRFTVVFATTAEQAKVVDHVVHLEPAPVPEPEPTSEETTPSTTQGGDEPEGEPNQSQPRAAYNPETGEIDWDCPCLGGMAHGPCGMQFREAFSCFVFSEQEPKGIDCVEKFKAMQDCFREHPDVYAEGTSTVCAVGEPSILNISTELGDDDDDDPNATTESPEPLVPATETEAPH
jgi:intermembrane space import and assembly protein 40